MMYCAPLDPGAECSHDALWTLTLHLTLYLISFLAAIWSPATYELLELASPLLPSACDWLNTLDFACFKDQSRKKGF